MSVNHTFNIEIAEDVGVHAAVIFNEIYWWIKKNSVDDINYIEEKYWTYNSVKAWTKYFSYMTERQVNYALKKLIDKKYIITGNYNKANYDKTLWYTITDLGYEKLGVEKIVKVPLTNLLKAEEDPFTNLLNGINKNVKPIQVNKQTVNKQSILDNKLSKNTMIPKTDLYSFCINCIDRFCIDHIEDGLRDCLIQYLNFRLEVKDKPLYKNMWQGLLKKLYECRTKSSNYITYKDIINQSLEKGYLTFYPISRYNSKKEDNIHWTAGYDMPEEMHEKREEKF